MATLGASRFRSHTRPKAPDDVDRTDAADIAQERSKRALMFSTLSSQQTARIAIKLRSRPRPRTGPARRRVPRSAHRQALGACADTGNVIPAPEQAEGRRRVVEC